MLLHWLSKIAWTLTRYKIVYVQFHNRRKAYIIKRYILGFIPFIPERVQKGYDYYSICEFRSRIEAAEYLVHLENKIIRPYPLGSREIPEDNK